VVFTLNIHMIFLSVAIVMGAARVILELIFVDPRKLRSYSEKVKKWRRRAREALKSRDPRLIARIQREKKVIDSIMMEMTKMRYKSMMILMVISLLIFWLIVLPRRSEAVYIPPLLRYISGIWYFVMISITTNAVFSIYLKYKGYE